MRTESEVNRVIGLYSDLIFKLALSYVKDYSTAEDIMQTVFMKYMLNNKPFVDAEHEKAWLIRVTINECKMYHRLFWNAKREMLDENMSAEQKLSSYEEVTQAVFSLPCKYRVVIHLHYYEGYSVKEIAESLGKKENTVLSLLHRGRKLLRKELEGYEGIGNQREICGNHE